MIKLALISDIHGNYKALEAFLKYLEKHRPDGIICLGDYVTDAPYPQRTMELLYRMQRQYTCYMIRGNREDYLLNNADNHENWKPSSANGMLFYTAQNLTEKDMTFFAALPTEKELEFEDYPSLCICHGIPGRVRGNVTEEAGLREKVLSALPGNYLLGGHSHHQEIFVQGEKAYINPGSLGFAIDGVGRHAQFAMLTGRTGGEIMQKRWGGIGRPVCSVDCFTEGMSPLIPQGEWEAKLLSISYDVDGYLKDFSESGADEIGMTLNKAIKKSLVTGVNYFYKCIVAMEEKAKAAGVGGISGLPEAEWRKLEEYFGL